MFDFLSSRIVYPLYWKSRGLDVRGKLPLFAQNELLPAGGVQELQMALLSGLLKHAYANVPYYRKVMDGLACRPEDIRSMNDFRKLPFLTKEDIREHATELIATNYSTKAMVRDSTGGSTGNNISFYEDKEELACRFAAAIRSDSWAGLKPGGKYAQIWGSVLDLQKSARLRHVVDRLLLRRLFISSFNLSDAHLIAAARKIKSFGAKTLIGYPTPLSRFARFLSERKTGNLGITSIISSSETLTNPLREIIERQFGLKVFNRYGSREFGVLASECEAHNGLHTFTDRFVFEYERIKNAEDPELSEVIVTDLHKFGMPFIRYKIGDVGIPSHDLCSCGRPFPMIKRIEGRRFDLILGTNGNVIAGTFWTLLFRTAPGIRMFQVVQENRNSLQINLDTDEGFDEGILRGFEERIKDRCGQDMSIIFRRVSPIPNSASGKFRFVICKIDIDA